jgi:phosphonatase-like hydrolase
MIQLVVFDIAGTTLHDGDAVKASFLAALATKGIASDPALVDFVMGLPKADAVRVLLKAASRPDDEATVRELHDDFTRRMIDYYRTSTDIREIPPATQLFAKLRAAGKKVALNSGFSRAIVDVLLGRLNWTVPETLDAVITSDEVSQGRPAPEMISTLMEKLHIADPKTVAKIGDTKVDLEEGANAGCGLNIGVTSGSFIREQLLAYPHTHIVGSIAELPPELFA